jgi:malonyl-CoA/methylmalonyl-CoA synthetase
VNLLHLFDLSLIERADEVALEWAGEEYTFGEIEARSNRAAHALLARGFERGDRLCVYLPNRIELIDLFLACVKLGVIFVPINVLYREREIAHIVGDAEPRLVVDEGNVDEVAGGSRLAAGGEEDAAGGRPQAAGQIDGDTPAAIIYTSGTTGTSKGAVLTHNNFASNAVNLTAVWKISSADRFLLSLPLFHIHALGNGLHAWLLSGCRMRLLERFDHRAAIGEFEDFAPTLFFGVPTIYVRLLETAPEVARRIGKAMRLFVSGSAPLPAQVLERFRDLFGHTILERYGMTETFMNTSNPYVGERRAGTVGFPLPGLSIRVEEGELLVRGPNVFAGYWRRDDATAKAFTDDGFFRTGDLAEVSDDGYITLLGRKSDLIISGGFNIYPREIEELLLEQDGVREAAVVGVADDLRGEVPVAFIVGECDAARLERVCRDQLASFKVPRRFVPVDSIPRTALGKVQKHLLKPTGG